MRVDPGFPYPDSTSPDALVGRFKGKPRLELGEPEKRLNGSSRVRAMENVVGPLGGQAGQEIDSCLADAGERQTKQPSRPTYKQPRFHIKTFLSKAGTGRTIVYAPGKQILFEQGKRGDAVFYILAGTVKLTVVSQGRETTIGLLGPGNFAGKECIATVRPRRTTSARALTNCTIVRIARKEMLRVIQHEKAFTAFFLDYLLACIGRNQEVIVDQLVNPSDKRLARALLSIANFRPGGKPEEVVPQIHQEELAEMVGTTRSRISFFMNRFRKLGFIAYKGQSSITISTAKLARFVMA
ncbi:MAG: Crp/Fnr family transcriptional regulator [Terriglobales bacterium]